MKYVKIFFLMCIVGLWSVALGFDIKESPKVQKRISPQENSDVLYSFSSSIEDATKAVVNISTQKNVSNQFSNHPMFNDPFFSNFLAIFMDRFPKIG